MPWVQFFAAVGLFMLFYRRMKLSRLEAAALVMTCGLGNTSFLGYPILEAAYGASAIKIAVFCDQLGSFFVLSSVELIFSEKMAGTSANIATIVQRLLR